MLFTEFNVEDALEVRGEEKFAEGRLKGLAEGKAVSILELLEERGQVPAKLEEIILGQRDLEILSQWHKLAATVKDIREFESLFINS